MLRVVKLGGSLHDSPRLSDWLDALARAGGRIVLVPGGGPFADAVRAAQGRLGFSDTTAHRMALLAMEQYGLMLCDLNPDLRPVGNPQAITAAVARGLTPVWLPSAMCLGAQDIPENWSVTSDSLAVWLAHHLGAEAMALVKHRRDDVKSLQAMVEAGQLDRQFTGFAARFAKPVRILGHDDPDALDAWLASPVVATLPKPQIPCVL